VARNPAPTDRKPEPLALDLYVEVAPGGACMGHVPSLPGLCFRANSVSELLTVAPTQVSEYGEWLTERSLDDLTPQTRRFTTTMPRENADGIRLRERECLTGAPVWESGNPAALFSIDHRTLSDEEVAAHLQFVGAVVRQMRTEVASLTSQRRTARSAPGRRTIDETLEHIGNCVWWYASRIDDRLPEPPDVEAEDPLDRIDRLVARTGAFLLGIAPEDRKKIHVPRRFLTSDPDERWTHAKVCRREAEHAWAHLPGITRAVEAARQAQ
jgi:hypothetical protein